MTPNHPVRPWVTCNNNPCTCKKPKSPAPDPSPYEQSVIDRFDAAEEPEEIRVERVARAIEADLDGRCLLCLRPLATDHDWAHIAEGEGEHLCWEPVACGVHVEGLTLSRVAAAAAIAALDPS